MARVQVEEKRAERRVPVSRFPGSRVFPAFPVFPVSLMLLLCLAAAALSGCGKTELASAYDLDTRVPALLSDADGGRADAFAAEISVVSGEDDAEPAVTGASAGVFSLSGGTALFHKDVFARMNPASTTKVMTALIALKYGNLDDAVTVTDAAVIDEPGSSMAGIVPGDVLTLRDLLYGLLIPSGNDAANAIAVHLAGSVEAFAERMNEEAASLGATGTHFANANGLTDPDHYTTAYDLYLMFRAAMQYETFREIIGTKSYTASYTGADGEAAELTWNSGNYYFNDKAEAPEGLTVLGGKTGTTKAAGYCLILASRADSGEEYASVVMDADSRSELYGDMTKLISKIVK